jgi:hypothetical protein
MKSRRGKTSHRQKTTELTRDRTAIVEYVSKGISVRPKFRQHLQLN